MAQEKNTVAKRSNSKHFSISILHEEALMRLVEELKEMHPDKAKSVNASSTLEWMIEKICGKHDMKLADYIRARNEMSKLTK